MNSTVFSSPYMLMKRNRLLNRSIKSVRQHYFRNYHLRNSHLSLSIKELYLYTNCTIYDKLHNLRCTLSPTILKRNVTYKDQTSMYYIHMCLQNTIILFLQNTHLLTNIHIYNVYVAQCSINWYPYPIFVYIHFSFLECTVHMVFKIWIISEGSL